MTDSVFIGGWLEFIFNNYFVQSSARKSFFTVVPAPVAVTLGDFGRFKATLGDFSKIGTKNIATLGDLRRLKAT